VQNINSRKNGGDGGDRIPWLCTDVGAAVFWQFKAHQCQAKSNGGKKENEYYRLLITVNAMIKV
jgi:hypothetical protein